MNTNVQSINTIKAVKYEEQAHKTMKCLIKKDLKKNGLDLEEGVGEPSPKFGEVKIRVLATSVCGTDKSIYNSANNAGIRHEMQRYLGDSNNYQPIIVGHEFCGIVEELGPGIIADNRINQNLRIEIGDYVTAEMHISCGHCLLCRTGNEHICTSVQVKGVHLDGCFAQYVVVPYKNVILLSKANVEKDIPIRIGAMLDAFGNAVHTVCEADVAGKSVAILGAGPLGLMTCFLCRAYGATHIYLTEAQDIERRFALGKEFGADYCIDVSKGSEVLYKTVAKNATGANGVDVVLEMSGAPSAYNDAFKIIRNGGTVILVGIAREPLAQFDIANGVIWKGATVKGIFGRKMFSTWETMLELVRTKHLNLIPKLDKILASKIYKLDEYKEAFETLSSGKEMKLVFTPNGLH
jgi:threonine 3-dehydrogenase